MLLQKRNDDFDCVKTFDLISSYIIAVSKIFKTSNIQMGNVSVEYLIVLSKVLFFQMRVPLLGFRPCKINETF